MQAFNFEWDFIPNRLEALLFNIAQEFSFWRSQSG
jgi:hypothetical protein